MIRNTLANTKNATFAVIVPHPDPELHGFPYPKGTAFFVSRQGYFVTARHVLEKSESDKTLYNGTAISLTNPEKIASLIDGISIIRDWPDFDLVLLKADWEKNKSKAAFQGKTGFDFLEIDFNVIAEGTPVYAFGYPLPEFRIQGNEKLTVGFHFFCPRVTSAILSSHYEFIGSMRRESRFPKFYIIDKALNYGNSGGPIIVQETGKVVSVCVRFQPVRIRQDRETTVVVPSLYGIASSLTNIENDLEEIIR